jgi:hypothetical protein
VTVTPEPAAEPVAPVEVAPVVVEPAPVAPEPVYVAPAPVYVPPVEPVAPAPVYVSPVTEGQVNAPADPSDIKNADRVPVTVPTTAP